MGVGWPAEHYLYLFGEVVREVFGEIPYHVGSSVELKDGWRDVDVRVMLSEEDWAAWGLKAWTGPHPPSSMDARWQGICLAFSALGKQMTGLPIDFQLQPVEWANKYYSSTYDGQKHPRSACASLPRDYVDYKLLTLTETIAARRSEP